MVKLIIATASGFWPKNTEQQINCYEKRKCHKLFTSLFSYREHPYTMINSKTSTFLKNIKVYIHA